MSISVSTLSSYHQEENATSSKLDRLKARYEKLNIKFKHVYSLNYSARKEVETLKKHKQSVLKAVITLILDDKMVMTDNELEERYFVDIGNIRQTRNTIKNERK